MATGTLGSIAKDYPARNSVLSAVINLANLAPTQTFKVGTVPAGAAITRILTCVQTAFNYGTNNNISIGNAPSGAQIVAAAAVGGVGANAQTVIAAASISASDIDVWITGAFTGTVGNTGLGFVWVEFASPTGQ